MTNGPTWSASDVADSVVHYAQTFDPATRLPVVVIDSTGLPPLQTKSDFYTSLVPEVVKRLPKTNYVLLFFACGAPNKPSWSWVAKTYSMLERDAKKRVRKLIVVHESWWVRAITEMLRGVVSSKFRSKVIHVSSLSQLAQHLDITLINISPSVYLHDLKIDQQITVPRHHTPVFSMPLNITRDAATGKWILPAVWTTCIEYICSNPGYYNPAVFRRTERVDMLYILRDSFDRGQLLDMGDYGPVMAANLLKLYIYQLPVPLLPVTRIPLPIQDTPQFCISVVSQVPWQQRVLLVEFVDLLTTIWASHPNTSSSVVAASVGPSICGASCVSRDQIAIGVRFVRNLLDLWTQVRRSIEASLHEQPAKPHFAEKPEPPLPRSPGKTRPSRPFMPFSHESLNAMAPPPMIPPYSNQLNANPLKPDSLNMNPLQTSQNTNPLRMNSLNTNLQAPRPPPSRGKNVPCMPDFSSSVPAPSLQQPCKPARTFRSVSTASSEASQSSSDSSSSISTENLRLDSLSLSSTPTKPAPPLPPTPNSPTKRIVRRGKMVAELAKLYEERADTAQILVKIRR